MSPGMVYCVALISTCSPSPRRVDEVTGPMEASKTLSSCFVWRQCARRSRPFPNSATKFLTVEELVNVMTSGRFFPDASAARRRLREDWGRWFRRLPPRRPALPVCSTPAESRREQLSRVPAVPASLLPFAANWPRRTRRRTPSGPRSLSAHAPRSPAWWQDRSRQFSGGLSDFC